MEESTELRIAEARAEVGDWESARVLYGRVAARTGAAAAYDGLARSCWWVGEYRSAVVHAQEGVDRYDREGRQGPAAMLGLQLCLWWLTIFDNVAAARGWLVRARRLSAKAREPVVEGWVDLVAGYLAEDAEEGRAHLERAAEVARSAADRDLATMALADLGLWRVGRGDVEAGLAMLDEAMTGTIVSPPRMREVVVWSSCNMLAACSLLDDLRRATDWCRAAERFMDTHGCPFLLARCRAHYGAVLMSSGRWEEAERELSQALAMAVDTGPGPRTEALGVLAELRRRQGRPELALELLEGPADAAAAAGTRAACLAATGRVEEAREVMRARLALADPADPGFPALVAAAVDAELSAGDVESAASLVEAGSAVWDCPAYARSQGLLARAVGLVAERHGDAATARRELARARDAFLGLDLPFEVARTELDLAHLLAGTEPLAAAGSARSAWRRLDALGARGALAEAAALLRSLGVVPPAGARAREDLSRRERDVLELLAQGLSNPEIAQRLFLSPRTVAHHVSSILRKLGLRSRAEAAAFAVRSPTPR